MVHLEIVAAWPHIRKCVYSQVKVVYLPSYYYVADCLLLAGWGCWWYGVYLYMCTHHP